MVSSHDTSLSVISDIELFDLEEGTEAKFALADLSRNVEKLGFIIGVQREASRIKTRSILMPQNSWVEFTMRWKRLAIVVMTLSSFLCVYCFCLFADDTGFSNRAVFFKRL